MRRTILAALAVLAMLLGAGATALAASSGPSGSTECHVQDDDCDGLIDEDTGGIEDDNDGDGLIDEDPRDGVDNDGDGLIDEDPRDDDDDGLIDEDPAGNATSDENENQVACGEGEDVAGVKVYNDGESSLEVCNDGGNQEAPQGRAVATSQDGGYIAVDGDADNEAPADSYVRIDQDGVHCGDDNNQDSTAAQDTNTIEDCGDTDSGASTGGPSGSTETDNQVDCADSGTHDVAGSKAYAGSNGAELCNDEGGTAPAQGRAIASGDQGGYAAVDGDADNQEPGNGYARVDQDGVHCGDENNQDSTAVDQSANTLEDCG